MAKVSGEVLREVKAALVRYENEVNGSLMRPKPKDTYILHAGYFVRWLEDDFTPGAKLKN